MENQTVDWSKHLQSVQFHHYGTKTPLEKYTNFLKICFLYPISNEKKNLQLRISIEAHYEKLRKPNFCWFKLSCAINLQIVNCTSCKEARATASNNNYEFNSVMLLYSFLS